LVQDVVGGGEDLVGSSSREKGRVSSSTCAESVAIVSSRKSICASICPTRSARWAVKRPWRASLSAVRVAIPRNEHSHATGSLHGSRLATRSSSPSRLAICASSVARLPEHVLKRGVGQRIGQALGGDPRPVADRPALPVAVDVAVAQQLLGDAMTRSGPSSSQIVTTPHEITQSFLLGRGRLHEHQLSSPVEPHQLLGVPTIGLDPIACADRDQRGGDHIACHPDPRQQPVKLVAARTAS
jgi:hypothetical protein